MSEQPVVWRSVIQTITDTASSFDLVIHPDGAVRAEGYVVARWERATISAFIIPLIRVPPTTLLSDYMEYETDLAKVVLKRNAGPVSMTYSQIGNTQRCTLSAVVSTFVTQGN